MEVDPASAGFDLEAALRRLGLESFRPGQREAITTLLDAGRLLLIAPTGGGKSLSFQLPALLLPGTTVVLSPLRFSVRFVMSRACVVSSEAAS